MASLVSEWRDPHLSSEVKSAKTSLVRSARKLTSAEPGAFLRGAASVGG